MPFPQDYGDGLAPDLIVLPVVLIEEGYGSVTVAIIEGAFCILEDVERARVIAIWYGIVRGI